MEAGGYAQTEIPSGEFGVCRFKEQSSGIEPRRFARKRIEPFPDIVERMMDQYHDRL
jgi:hypothetical protein